MLKEENKLTLEYEKRAYKDIKDDHVKLFSHGLPLPPKDQKKRDNMDKITKIHENFGLYRSSTCIVSEELTEAENKYEEITEEYLLKRNGKNWKQKMKSQIDSIENK